MKYIAMLFSISLLLSSGAFLSQAVAAEAIKKAQTISRAGCQPSVIGDIFGRDNLDFKSREIATISALSSMTGVNAQLQSHFNVGFNVGLTQEQMRSLISVLELKVGKKEADNAFDILEKVITARGQK